MMAKTYKQSRAVTAAAVITLLGLVIVAAISIHQTRALSIPIPKATGIAALILPILTGLSLQSGSTIAHRSKKASLPYLAITMFIALTIYETVIITLSLTHIVPPSDFNCHLDQRWQQLYSKKNAAAIERIQDGHNCCGLHSVKDRAWPFPAKGQPATTCESTYRRDRSCLAGWRRDEQVYGGLLLAVAVGTFMVKLSVILFARARTPWTMDGHHFQSRNHDREDSAPTAHSQRRIEAQYHDDESSDGEIRATDTDSNRAINNGNSHADGPAMQASSFRNEQRERNEWA